MKVNEAPQQYIRKSALVAEIERLKSIQFSIFSKGESIGRCYDSLTCISVYNEILSFLDTLEVKEVDLKQSYREYINNTYNEEFAQSILDNNIKGDLDNSDLFGIMSYGFELGLSVSNKAQKGE